ncbi:MAG TPA: hypothetical protein VNT99_05745 [Methylomirabilota bacterium]|nr:hypothetical protein [Methylomirabilota bacterium]
MRLCDFASAGVGGSRYRSWLDVDGVAGLHSLQRIRSARDGETHPGGKFKP